MYYCLDVVDDVCLDSRPNLKKYISFLQFDLKISRPYYVKDKKIYMRSFNGEEKRKIFSNIELKNLFPDLEKIDLVDRIWKNFYNIYFSIKDNAYQKINRIESIKKNTGEWLELFRKVYQDENITPYIHIFVQHLYEIVDLHEDINLFTMQGLEKLNDMTTKHYFNSTNKGSNYLTQLLAKRNRMEYMSDINYSFDNRKFSSLEVILSKFLY